MLLPKSMWLAEVVFPPRIAGQPTSDTLFLVLIVVEDDSTEIANVVVMAVPPSSELTSAASSKALNLICF